MTDVENLPVAVVSNTSNSDQDLNILLNFSELDINFILQYPHY